MLSKLTLNKKGGEGAIRDLLERVSKFLSRKSLNDLVNIFGKWDHYNGKAKEPCVGFFCDEKQVGNYCIDVTAWLGGRWNKVVLKREVSRLSIFVSKKYR